MLQKCHPSVMVVWLDGWLIPNLSSSLVNDHEIREQFEERCTAAVLLLRIAFYNHFLHVLFCYIRLLVSFCVSPENNKEKLVLLFLLLSGVDKTGLKSVLLKRRPWWWFAKKKSFDCPYGAVRFFQCHSKTKNDSYKKYIYIESNDNRHAK